MNKTRAKAFLRRLQCARQAVIDKDTSCQQSPSKCWHCAMRFRGGLGKEGYFAVTFTGPHKDWSFRRPHAATVALFDQSIAAFKKEYGL